MKISPIPVQTPSAIATKIGLAIGLPFSGRGVPPEWGLTFSSQIYPSNIKRSTIAVKGKPVDEARCEIAQMAVDSDAQFLWFVDEDLSMPPHACRTLLNTLANADRDTMVCGGIYTWKTRPCEPLVYRRNGIGPFCKWKFRDVFECDGLATGMMLINTELFKHLEKPWFKTVDEVGTHQTEDLYFCDKVRAAGFKILADSNVIAIHWNDEPGGWVPYYPEEDSYPMRPVTALEPRCERSLDLVSL